jgi:hypothetical protein
METQQGFDPSTTEVSRRRLFQTAGVVLMGSIMARRLIEPSGGFDHGDDTDSRTAELENAAGATLEVFDGPVTPLSASELTDTPLLGPDTSQFNMIGNDIKSGLLDPNQLIRDGYRYWLARASTGMREDILFKHARERAKDSNILFGAYHWQHPDLPARDQADLHAEILDRTGGVDGLLHVLDVENVPHTDNSPSIDKVNDYIDQFRKNIKTGRLILYTARYVWKGHLGDPAAPEGTELWYAYPFQTPGLNVTTPQDAQANIERPSDQNDPMRDPYYALNGYAYPLMRQYTASATIDGIPKPLDMNASFVPEHRLYEMAGLRPKQ